MKKVHDWHAAFTNPIQAPMLRGVFLWILAVFRYFMNEDWAHLFPFLFLAVCWIIWMAGLATVEGSACGVYRLWTREEFIVSPCGISSLERTWGRVRCSESRTLCNCFRQAARTFAQIIPVECAGRLAGAASVVGTVAL